MAGARSTPSSRATGEPPPATMPTAMNGLNAITRRWLNHGLGTKP